MRFPLNPIACRVATLLVLLLLANCARTPSHTSRMQAERYFEGQGLELAIAAENGDLERIRQLMREQNVDPDRIFSKDGIPLVAWPLRAERLDSLRAMLDNGADPNARLVDERKNTFTGDTEPFPRNNAMVLAAAMHDPRYLELLLDHGGDPNTRNSNNETLLYQAFVSENQWPNIQLLVERGADVNASVFGLSHTPVTWYATRGAFDRVWWLIQHGADPAVLDRMPDDPPDVGRMIAVEHIYWRPTLPEQIASQRQCQQWLIDHGIARPPLPDTLRAERQRMGYPYEDADAIPLLAEYPNQSATPKTATQ